MSTPEKDLHPAGSATSSGIGTSPSQSGSQRSLSLSSASLSGQASPTGGATAFASPRSSLKRLVSQLPENVRKFSWELQREIAKLLDPLKDPVGNDWRMVASRLCFGAQVVQNLEDKKNPTMELLKLCNNITSEDFFRVVAEIDRFDIIEDLLDVFLKFPFPGDLGLRLPTQESLDDSTSSDQFYDASCSGSDTSQFSRSPSEHKEDEDSDDSEKFITQASQEFWCNIPGHYYHKKWKDFFEAMKRACPEESQKGCVAKFLCQLYKINYGERDSGTVKLKWFFRLLAWFGPLIPGKEGCLHKIHELMTKSVSKDITGKQSWFAGHMDETESEKLLRDQTPGHFLVRFSSSRADDGYFVLAVRTRDRGVVQIQIEAVPKEEILQLGGRVFPNLLEIITALRKEVLLEECPQLLINPCPNLPLNAMFTGYAQGGARRRSAGRGRGTGGTTSGH